MSDVSESTSASTKSFATALVFNAIVFGVEIAIFTILRPRFKAIYEPRTYIPPSSKRADTIGSSIFAWPLAVGRSDYKAIIKANGLDAYFFVRFLRMMTRVFFPIWIISWAVLLPITSVKTHVGNNQGLDLFIFGNVENTKQARYAAHIILVWVFTFWVYWNIKYEMREFITTRQKHLISSEHAASVQANTLLITGIPTKYLSEGALTATFNHLPGGVKKVWINRNLGTLPDFYDRRMAACGKLESAQVSLLNMATKKHFKPKKGKAAVKGDPNPDADIEHSPGQLSTLVPREERPMHRLKPTWAPFALPFMGQKVDTIEWCREEIRLCDDILERGKKKVLGEESADRAKAVKNDAAEDLRDSSDVDRKEEDDMAPKSTKAPEHEDGSSKAVAATGHGSKDKDVIKSQTEEYLPMNSAFITFNQQIAAHLGMQALTHHEPYRMSGKYTEVSPEDVIWTNLGLNPYEQKVRMLIGYGITAGLILFWAIPVAFVGVISNIPSLCVKYSWLAWICKLPSVVVGIISGILPPVALLVLMMLLPIILRLLAKFEGIPKHTGLELSLMTRFFIFQVIHSFLIVTLASGLIAALPQLASNPTSIPTILAQKLPQSSTFFLTYVILQGLSGTAGGFLQIAPLAIYYVKLFILGSTPRSVYGIKYGLRSVAWGTLFPSITLLVVVSLAYSIISPIINGLACATFFLFYMLYKYLFLYAFGQPASSDTGGLFFPKAIQHVFVGLYVQQVCLCALFFLARDENANASALPQGGLMIVLIIFTIFFQMLINNSYGPLLHALPLTLADKTYGATPSQVKEERRGNNGKGEPEMALEDRDQLNAPQERELDRKKQAVSEEEYGFAHPAASRPQRIIWLPTDPLGLVKEEESGNEAHGITTSIYDATMDEKGHVDIQGPPPDEQRGDD